MPATKMILTKELYDHRVAVATGLTAMGLKRGRDYYHKDVHVYSTSIVGNMEYTVDPTDGKSMTFNSPYTAANRFVDLVVEKWRG